MDTNALIQLLSGQPAGAGISGLLQGNGQNAAPDGAFQAILSALGITPEGSAALAALNTNGLGQPALNVGQATLDIGQANGQPAPLTAAALQSLILTEGGNLSSEGLEGLVQAGLISAEEAALITGGGAVAEETIAQVPGLATALSALMATAVSGEGVVETGQTEGAQTTQGAQTAQDAQTAQTAQGSNATTGELPNGVTPEATPTDRQILPAGLALLTTAQSLLNGNAVAKTGSKPEALLEELAGASAAATTIAQQAGQSTMPTLPGTASLKASTAVEAVFSGTSPSSALADLRLAQAEGTVTATSNSQGQPAQNGAALHQGAQASGAATTKTAVDDLMAQFQAPNQTANGLQQAAANAKSLISGQFADAAAKLADDGQPTGTDVQALTGRAGDAQPITLTSLSAQNAASIHGDPAVSTAVAGKATEQIAISIFKAVKLGNTEFTVRLDPPQLGRVDVKMEILSDGRVHATLSADRGDTLDVLQRDVRVLERAFQDSGLKPDTLTFNLRQEGRGNNLPLDQHDEIADPQNGEQDVEDTPLPAATPQMDVSSGALDIRV